MKVLRLLYILLTLIVSVPLWADTYCLSVYNSTPSYNPATTSFTYSGANDEHKLEGFVVPDKDGENWPLYWVGLNGEFRERSEGKPLGRNNATSAEATLADIPLKAYRENTIGLAAGAVGTLHIYDNSNWNNLYIEFSPAGYGMNYGVVGQGGWKYLAFHQTDTYIWESDVVQATREMINEMSFWVGLKATTDYVFSSTMSATQRFDARVLSGVTPNTYGHFRININASNDHNNWNVEWVADAAEITHVQGLSGRELLDNGMQDVHTYERTIYMKSGDQQILYRPDATTYREYVRWYDYQSDTRAAEVTGNTAANYTMPSGLYYLGNTGGVTFTAPANFTSTNYPNGIDIACDQSSYKDGIIEAPGAHAWSEMTWYVYRITAPSANVIQMNKASILAAASVVGDQFQFNFMRCTSAGNFVAFSNGEGWQGASRSGNTTKEALYNTANASSVKTSNYVFTMKRATEDGGFYIINGVGYYLCIKDGSPKFSASQQDVWYLEDHPEAIVDANMVNSGNADADVLLFRNGSNNMYLGNNSTATNYGWNNMRVYLAKPDNTETIVIEPTLSQRLLFHIKPASEMSASVGENTMAVTDPKNFCWAIRKSQTDSNFPAIKSSDLAGLSSGTIQIIWPESRANGGYALTNEANMDNTNAGYSGYIRDWNTATFTGNGTTWYTQGGNWEYTYILLEKDANGYMFSRTRDAVKYYITVQENSMTWDASPSNSDDYHFDILPVEIGITINGNNSANNYLFRIKAKNGYYLYSGGQYNATTSALPINAESMANTPFLEEKFIIAPAGPNIFEGPALQWKSGSSFDYASHTYYYDNNGTPTACTATNGTWQWYRDGVAFTPAQVITGRFIQLPNTTTPNETHVYTLQYTPNSGRTAYNICKLTVELHEQALVGPSASLGYDAVVGAERKAYESFNYPEKSFATINRDGHSIHYCTDPVPFDESAYGFYYGVPEAQHTGGGGTRNFPYWGEYGIQSYASTGWGIGYNLANHHETRDNIFGMDETKGYMLYVDGSQIPGEVFMLNVEGLELCPGTKMYCSAWVSSVTAQNSTKPNLDFEVTAKVNGVWKNVLTFSTGEISNADLPNSKTDGKWRHIVFPVTWDNTRLGSVEDATDFRVKIVNKGKDASGNDFAIDDISFYAKHPPILPIQASSAGCIEVGGSATVPTYLRVDYHQLVESEGEMDYYYCWTDKDGQAINTMYLNKTSTQLGEYGVIHLADVPTETPELVYTNFTDWDNKRRNDTEPHYGYVMDRAASGEERYFLYISQPLVVEPNKTFHSIVAGDTEDLKLNSTCAMHTALTIIGGAQVLVDGGAYVDTTNVCGNKIYTLQGSMSFMVRKTDPETGEVSYEATAFECPADWLVGSEAFIDSCHTAGTGEYNNYTFAEIDAAIKAHTELGENPTVDQFNMLPEAQRTIINWLVAHKMLTLGETTIDVNPVLDGYGVVTEMHYMSYPVHKQFDASLSACPNPQDIKFNLPDDGQFNGIGIGTESANLPNRILHEPRRIRVQAANAAQARITLPIHLLGNQENTYEVEQALLFQTNDDTDLDFEEGAPDVGSGDKVKGRLAISPSNITSSVHQITLTGTALRNLKKGKEYIFYIDLVSESGCDVIYTYFQLQIIPDVVTLKKDATVWNSDESWVEGYAPLPGTSVVLPATAVTIPTADQVLNVSKGEQLINVYYEDGAQDYITYDVNYVPFACKDIYLPAGACLMNQTQLTIGGKAYIDVPFTANKWQLASFPIQGVVSGDVFIPQSENSGATHPFSVKEMTTPADRYLHPFYHNLYNASVVNTTGSGSCEETVTSSTWLTKTTAAGAESGNTANGTTIPYGYGDGAYNAAALWLDEAATGASGASSGVVRLPKKADATYSYYDKNTHEWIGYLSESVTRSGDSNYGKPAYTNGGGQTFTLRGNTAGTVFLFGNPTLAYIDMGKFMTANSSVLTGTVYRYDGSHYVAYHSIGADGSHHWYLPPYSAVLVEAKYAGTEVNVTISNAMLSAATPEAPASAPQRNSVQSAEPSVQNTIFITAQSGEFTTYAAAIEGEGSNLYDEEEDAEVFLMAPEQTPFTIYTTADNHALAINRHTNLDYLPVCLYSNEPAMQGLKQTTYLTFSGDNDYLSEWDLVMLGTTKQAALKDGLKVKIGLATDGTPNIALQHTRRPITTSVDKTEAHALHAFAHQGTILVYADLPIGELQIYTPSGQLIYQKQNVGTMHEIQLPEAVYVLRANGQAIKLLNY